MNNGKIPYFFFCLSFLALLAVSSATAQPGDEIQELKKEIEAIKKIQKLIIKQLNSLGKRAGGRIPPLKDIPPNAVISVAGEPYKGNKNARITMIEFSDYQCPYCARHVRNTMPRLEKEYIQTGKVKYVFRDFPIVQIHPQAPKAHEAANCAGRQNKYWEIHDIFFQNQKSLAPRQLKKFAASVGLDMAKFGKCLDDGEEAAEVKQDGADGRAAHIRGTPTFLIGFTQPNEGKVKTVRRIVGAQPFSRFKAAIDSLLSQKK